MKPAPRLFTAEKLSSARELELTREQGHYLSNVLRLAPGDPVSLFNAEDGEWLAYLTAAGRKHVTVRIEGQQAAVKPPPDIDFFFAPLKHARLDYMIQKATELGARRIGPVMTDRTIAGRVNLDRMRANAIEAAEQCNLVFVPEVLEPRKLAEVLKDWPPARALVYADETAEQASPLEALAKLRLPAALLVGPEGGFTAEERAMLRALPFVTAISLGPRIMRADTAAVSALTIVQASLGDWR